MMVYKVLQNSKMRIIFGVFIFIALVVLLLAGDSLVNRVILANWSHNSGQYGTTVDIGGQELFYSLKGEGQYTVIVEVALGDSWADWVFLQDELKGEYRVLLYSRAGYGFSTGSDNTRSSRQINDELALLLEKEKIDGPYILVGDGIGGLYMQEFAARHRERVKGALLIKPYTSAFGLFKEELRPVYYSNIIDRTSSIKIGKISASAGILRLVGAVPYKNIDRAYRSVVLNTFYAPSTYRTMLDEYKGGLKESLANQTFESFGTVPVLILHHNRSEFWKKMFLYHLSWDEIEDIDLIWGKLYDAVEGDNVQVVEALHGVDLIPQKEPGSVIAAFRKLEAMIAE